MPKKKRKVEDPTSTSLYKKAGFMSVLQKENLGNSLDIDLFKKLLKGMTEKVWWQNDAAAAVAATVSQCKLGNGKRRGVLSKGDVWLLFSGPDRVGKRKMVSALSSLVYGTNPIMIQLGSRQDAGDGNSSFRGKTALDKIAETVKRSPFSVILLEDIDEADMLVRGSIKQAMDRGRIRDSHGREISLGNVIFVMTASWHFAGTKTSFLDNEAKLRDLASESWRLRLCMREKFGKRRASWLCSDEERLTKPKKEHGSGLSFDLNQAADTDDGSHNTSDLTTDNDQDEQGFSGKLSLQCVPFAFHDMVSRVDDAVAFRAVDFAAVRRRITETLSERFETIIGESLSVEVEEEALQRILSGVWLGQTELEEWIEKAIVPVLSQLKARVSSSGTYGDCTVARLELDEDSGERNAGDLLPTTITLAVYPAFLYKVVGPMGVKVLFALICIAVAEAKPTENNEDFNIVAVASNFATTDLDADRGKLPGKKLPLEVLKELEANARKAGCTRGCLICLSHIKCTPKMKKFIPGRCHTYEGDKESAQGGIGEAIVDIPEIPGFKDLEPLEQFIAQVDLCVDCTTGCLKGLANVQCSDLLKKWLPQRCATFASKIQGQVDKIKGAGGDTRSNAADEVATGSGLLAIHPTEARHKQKIVAPVKQTLNFDLLKLAGDVESNPGPGTMENMENDENIVVGPKPFYPIEEGSAGTQLRKYMERYAKLGAIAFTNAVTGVDYSYAEYLEKSCCLGKALQNYGLVVDGRIALCSENCEEFFIPVIAGLFIGVGVAPTNEIYTLRELVHSLGISKPTIVFSSKKGLDKVITVQKTVTTIKTIVILDSKVDYRGYQCLDTFIKRNTPPGFQASSFKTVEVDRKEQVALIMNSSGSTGLPKGVQLTHENTVTRFSHARDPIYGNQVSPGTAVLTVVPFHHGFGMFTTLGYLICGFRVVMLTKFDEETFLKTLQDYKCTYVILVPTLFAILNKSELLNKYDLSNLVEIASGGAPLSKEVGEAVARRFNLPGVRQGYGLTETTSAIIITPEGDDKPGASGKVVPLFKAKVIDLDTKKSLGPNRRGEVCVKGPMLMKGYVNNPEATKELIDEEGWLHTGDIGYYDEEKHFFIVDRLKSLIKYKGYQVPPAELESVLLQHPSIFDAGVAGVPDPVAGELPGAVVVLESGKNMTEKEVMDYVASQVSNAKRLRGGVRFVDEVPKGLTGKIDGRAIREILKKPVAKM
nr:NLS/D2/gLUC/P-2A/redLUC fusion protein [Binary vector pMD19-SMAX1D2]